MTSGGRGMIRALTLGIAGALALCSWSAAQGQELHGLLSSTYSSIGSHASDGSSADYSTWREILDTSFKKSISDTLSYRLALRAERLDTTNTVTGGGGNRLSLDVNSTLIQPEFDLTLSTPGLVLDGGIRGRQIVTGQTERPSTTLDERFGFLRFFFSPERLPSVTLQVERLTLNDNTRPVSLDQDTTRVQVGTQYRIGDLTLGYNYGHIQRDDNQQQSTETQVNHFGNMGYLGRFLQDRLSIDTNLSLNYVNTVDEFNRAQTFQLARAPKATFNLPADPSPLVNNSSQFRSGPGLTPMVLGSAVGFTLVVADTVTQIVISIIPATQIPIPNNLASVLSFNVYETDKEPLLAPATLPILWSQVATTSQSWDPARSLFTITIPATANRSFKAWVATDASGVPMNVTGIAAPVAVSECQGCQVTQTTKSGALNAGISYTPIDAVTLGYNLNLNVAHVDPGSIDTTSGTHTLTLTYRPHPKVTSTALAQYSFNNTNQAGAPDTSLSTYSLTVTWSPLLTLVTNAVVARNESRSGGNLDFRTDSVNVNAAAKVFPGLQLDSGYTISKVDVHTTNQETWQQDLTFRTTAQMAPWISAVGNYALSVRDTTPAPPGQSSRTVINAVGGGTVYTISQLVNFTTRFDFISGTNNTGTGFNQSYKIDWVPTSKMSFYVNYFSTSSHNGNAKTSANTISANGRWHINRVLDLSADCAFSRTDAQGRILNVNSFSVTGSAKF